MLLQKQSHSNKLGLQLPQTLPLNSEVFNWPDIRGTFSCFWLLLRFCGKFELRGTHDLASVLMRHRGLGIRFFCGSPMYSCVLVWYGSVMLGRNPNLKKEVFAATRVKSRFEQPSSTAVSKLQIWLLVSKSSYAPWGPLYLDKLRSLDHAHSRSSKGRGALRRLLL